MKKVAFTVPTICHLGACSFLFLCTFVICTADPVLNNQPKFRGTHWVKTHQASFKKPENFTLNTIDRPFRDFLSKNNLPALVYMKINNLNVQLYRDDASNGSYGWTWATKGKGYFLRRLSPNFFNLSLSTLKNGVYFVDFNVSKTTCNGTLDEDEFINTISRFLIEEIRDAYAYVHSNENEFKVCAEYYSNDTKGAGTFKALLLNLHVYEYLPKSTEVKCWYSNDEETKTEKLFFWTFFLYVIIFVIGVVCFPMLEGMVIQRKPPVRDEDSLRLYKTTSLPIGMRYVLFIWKNEHYIAQGVRLIAMAICILSASGIEAIIYAKCVASLILFFFQKRKIDNPTIGDPSYYVLNWILMVIYVLIIIIVACLYVKRQDLFVEDDHQRKYLFFNFLRVRLRSNFQVPKADEYLPSGNKFYYYMMHRWGMAINLNLIWYGLPHFGESSSSKIFLFLKVITSLFYAVLILLFSCPSMYVLRLLLYSIVNEWKEIRYPILRLFVCLPVLFLVTSGLLFGTMRVVAGIASLTANVLEFTFVGVIVGGISQARIIVQSFSMIVYILKIMSSFYDTYYKLHLMIFKSAENVDECERKKLERDKDESNNDLENESKNFEPSSVVQTRDKIMISESVEHMDKCELKEHGLSKDESNNDPENKSRNSKPLSVVQTRDSITANLETKKSISDNLFWYVVNHCQPIRFQVLYSVSKLAASCFLLLTGFKILEEVDESGHLTDMGNMIFTIMIPFASNILGSTIQSQTNTDICRDELSDAVQEAVCNYKIEHAEDNPLVITKAPSEFANEHSKDKPSQLVKKCTPTVNEKSWLLLPQPNLSDA